jgi:hypothetical protein
MSCRTKASRSGGVSVSRTTSSASPTESARTGLVFRPGFDRDDRLRQPRADVVLAARAARAQHVEADARDDRRQPAAEVRDAVGMRALQPEPGLLDGVLGLTGRAEHPVRDCEQVAAVALELFGLQFGGGQVTSPRFDPSSP